MRVYDLHVVCADLVDEYVLCNIHVVPHPAKRVHFSFDIAVVPSVDVLFLLLHDDVPHRSYL